MTIQAQSYLFSCRVTVVCQDPAVRVMQVNLVETPPHRVISSMVCPDLLPGRLGR